LVQIPARDADVTKVTITVDGRSLACRPDVSLAVALWDHGIRHLSHSHKYGRPRGLTCARGHCTNCLMRVDGLPNIRTCETPVTAGMVVATQDTGTFYGASMQKLLALNSGWLPVGFYYKWFTKPATLSRFFLERIRPMTGVGRLPDSPQAQRSRPAADTEANAAMTTDLGRFRTIVIGAGPSGLQAAVTSLGPTLVVDDFAEPGGQRLAALRSVAGGDANLTARFPLLTAARERLEAAASALPAAPACRFLGGAKAIAGYHPDGLLVRQGQRALTARFENLVWAAGALDTVGLFPGNDTPGLFGPRALYRLLTRDNLDLTGQHVLVIGGGMDFWLSAALLTTHGASVGLVVTEGGCQSEVAAAVDLKWPLNTGAKLEEIKSSGAHKVQATLVPVRNAPGPRGSHMHLEADLMVICAAGKPAYDIPYQLGADLAMVPARGGFVPRGCDGSQDATFGQTLPSGAGLTFTGETLGFLPENQVTR